MNEQSEAAELRARLRRIAVAYGRFVVAMQANGAARATAAVRAEQALDAAGTSAAVPDAVYDFFTIYRDTNEERARLLVALFEAMDQETAGLVLDALVLEREAA